MGLIGAVAAIITVATPIFNFTNIDRNKTVSGSVLRDKSPIPNLVCIVESSSGAVVVVIDEFGRFSIPRTCCGRLIAFWEGKKEIYRGFVPQINEGLFDINL